MVHKFFVAFIPIFVAIDAIGLVAVFMGLAGDAPSDKGTDRASSPFLRRSAFRLDSYFSGK